MRALWSPLTARLLPHYHTGGWIIDHRTAGAGTITAPLGGRSSRC